MEIYGSVRNVFDPKPPLELHRPMARNFGYNPLDYSGALGRYFTVGLKFQFF